jgi:hypothetical protein
MSGLWRPRPMKAINHSASSSAPLLEPPVIAAIDLDELSASRAAIEVDGTFAAACATAIGRPQPSIDAASPVRSLVHASQEELRQRALAQSPHTWS